MLARMIAAWMAIIIGTARAGECPNQFSAPKRIVVFRTLRVTASQLYAETRDDYLKSAEAQCSKATCSDPNHKCRFLHSETQRECTEKDVGWTCAGFVHTGCFCMGAGETPQGLAPTPAAAPTPSETSEECSNRLGDPLTLNKDATRRGVAEFSLVADRATKIKDAVKECSNRKCSDGKNVCRMMYTTSKFDCNEIKNPHGWHCETQLRTGCFCLGGEENLLAMAAQPPKATGGEYAVAHPPYRGPAMLVGRVAPADCAPGETCSFSLVADPSPYEGVPGLVVDRVKVPAHKDSRGHATLTGVVVATNRGEQIPADGPIPYEGPPPGEPLLAGVELADNPSVLLDVPIASRSEEEPHKRTERAAMPPVVPDSGVCDAHGKFSGDGVATKVAVDGAPTRVIAETPHDVFFRPASDIPSGEKRVVISDEGRSTTYKMWVDAISIRADKDTLQEGESTRFHVTVSELPNSPEYWKAPYAGGEGSIALTIKNDSPQIGSITEGDVMTRTLHYEDCPGGKCTVDGTFVAQQAGSFELEATATPLLGDVPAESEKPTPTATRGGPGCCSRPRGSGESFCENMPNRDACDAEWFPGAVCGDDGRCAHPVVETPRPTEQTPAAERTPTVPPSLVRRWSTYQGCLSRTHPNAA